MIEDERRGLKAQRGTHFRMDILCMAINLPEDSVLHADPWNVLLTSLSSVEALFSRSSFQRAGLIICNMDNNNWK